MIEFIECTQCPCMMYLTKGQYGYYYFCVCGETHGCHQELLEPLGIPADKQTRLLRRRVHLLFDTWWKSEGYTRKQAYKELSKIINLPMKDTHIGSFNKEQCMYLIDYLAAEPFVIEDEYDLF